MNQYSTGSGTRSPRSFARTTAVRAPGKNSIAPTRTRRCDPDHRHALAPGPSPVLRVWPAMAGRDPRPRSLSRVRPAGEDRPGAAVRSRSHVTPPRPVSRPRRIAPRSGTPTPDHERPISHVTDGTFEVPGCHPLAPPAGPPSGPIDYGPSRPRRLRTD